MEKFQPNQGADHDKLLRSYLQSQVLPPVDEYMESLKRSWLADSTELPSDFPPIKTIQVETIVPNPEYL